MPLYEYYCKKCRTKFERVNSFKNSDAPEICDCGARAGRTPSVFSLKLFQPRTFADGSTVPEFVRTPKQEQAWMKAEGITYDPPTGRERRIKKEETEIKSKKKLESAFDDAYQKVSNGFRNETKEQIKTATKLHFAV